MYQSFVFFVDVSASITGAIETGQTTVEIVDIQRFSPGQPINI